MRTHEYYDNYIYSILFLNLFVYIFILINLFFILFIFDLKKLKSLSNFKFYNNLNFMFVTIIMIFLSFAGVPPLMGFVSKFLIFIAITTQISILNLSFFLFLNIFILYFYIQNFRFLSSSKVSNFFIFKNYKAHYNDKIIYIINFLNFLNLMCFFYFEEFLLFLNYITSYINL